MKKIALVLLFTLSVTCFAQEEKVSSKHAEKKHELKINALSLIAFSWLDVSYEYIINKESSIGMSTLISFNDNKDLNLNLYRTFSLTPYYRRYFSKKYAKGFFIEGFGMLNSRKFDYSWFDSSIKTKTHTDFAIGISAGAKFVTENGFIAEVHLGVGRNLTSSDYYNEVEDRIVGRGGISLGYRF